MLYLQTKHNPVHLFNLSPNNLSLWMNYALFLYHFSGVPCTLPLPILPAKVEHLIYLSIDFHCHLCAVLKCLTLLPTDGHDCRFWPCPPTHVVVAVFSLANSQLIRSNLEPLSCGVERFTRVPVLAECLKLPIKWRHEDLGKGQCQSCGVHHLCGELLTQISSNNNSTFTSLSMLQKEHWKLWGNIMTQLIELLPRSSRYFGSILISRTVCVEFANFPVTTWISSGCSSFLPHPKNVVYCLL